MSDLTLKQEELLNFIENFQNQNGFPPTISEMRRGLDLSSPSGIQLRLNNLEKAGRISRRKGHSRTVLVLKPS